MNCAVFGVTCYSRWQIDVGCEDFNLKGGGWTVIVNYGWVRIRFKDGEKMG